MIHQHNLLIWNCYILLMINKKQMLAVSHLWLTHRGCLISPDLCVRQAKLLTRVCLATWLALFTTGNRLFAECLCLCRGPNIAHSAKAGRGLTVPGAVLFAECQASGTRQRHHFAECLGKLIFFVFFYSKFFCSLGTVPPPACSKWGHFHNFLVYFVSFFSWIFPHNVGLNCRCIEYSISLVQKMLSLFLSVNVG
jgi:hypothetical protein